MTPAAAIAQLDAERLLHLGRAFEHRREAKAAEAKAAGIEQQINGLKFSQTLTPPETAAAVPRAAVKSRGKVPPVKKA